MNRNKFVIINLMILGVLTLYGWTCTCSLKSSSVINSDNGKISIAYKNSNSVTIPNDLKVAKNPTYKVGSDVIVLAKHMKGMYGAKARIVAAYDTIAYVVTYYPTTGGPLVKNHKWVVQEEIKNAGNKLLEPGVSVILEANHLKGMKGAKAIIDSAVPTTVYMIDYKPTTGAPIVKNHKWVIESELLPEKNEKSSYQFILI
ncbi:MAG: hypothetical protein K0R71_1635 [Bacillales bacterium]|nr:hypothetical protein [Bacillales bacterium]